MLFYLRAILTAAFLFKMPCAFHCRILRRRGCWWIADGCLSDGTGDLTVKASVGPFMLGVAAGVVVLCFGLHDYLGQRR